MQLMTEHGVLLQQKAAFQREVFID